MHRNALVVLCATVLCAANHLEHITGTRRPLQLFINKHYLAVHHNGNIDGTYDKLGSDTILQRVAIGTKHTNKTRILLRNAITCMYVCLDRCGNMYAVSQLSRDCILNEMYTESHYDIIYKVYNQKRAYVALDNAGKARRVQLSKRRQLRNMSKYTLILRVPVYSTMITNCPKQNIIIKHRKCDFNK